MTQKTEDDWIETFGEPLENAEGSTFFNTFSDDLAFVQKADEKTVWSIIEDDETENHYLLPGFHTVNLIGYVLAPRPITQEELDSGDWDEVLWVDMDELNDDGPTL